MTISETPERYDVIIIGGGPAGLSAGLYCKRAALKTVLFEKGLTGGQIAISKEVENYPGVQGITGFDLAEKLVRHAESFGLDIVRQEVAEVITGPDLHKVRLTDGRVLETITVLLACGGSVRKLGIPGEAEYAGAGVSYCATCDGYFFRGRSVVVVGGGDTAIEEALYLARLTTKVYLVHRRKEFRASKLLQERLAAEPKIELIRDTILTEIHGTGDSVDRVVLENLETGEKKDLLIDGVFIFIGYNPNIELVPAGVRMNDRGFVVTDEKCETTIPGIFALGDLRQKYANQIIVAAADGCIAALAAAHYVEEYKSRSAAV